MPSEYKSKLIDKIFSSSKGIHEKQISLKKPKPDKHIIQTKNRNAVVQIHSLKPTIEKNKIK